MKQKFFEFNLFNCTLLLLLSIGIGYVIWECIIIELAHREPLFVQTQRDEIMSTPQFNITAYIPKTVKDSNQVVKSSESAARIVEQRMNIYNPESELSKLNSAPADEWVTLSPETMSAVVAAKQAYEDTNGAFDATINPLIQLWKKAGKTNRLPTKEEITAARKKSDWSLFKIDIPGSRVMKTAVTAKLDLGGIAKGYAIDLALESLQKDGCLGGLVDIGGDIRCFGKKPDGEKWRVAVRNPFEPRSNNYLKIISLDEGAVCTSGNYERYSVIDGKHFSHILDPQTGIPVDACPSATVIAPTATQADAWATALSVLGEDGIKLLDEKFPQIKGMIVAGTKENYHIVKTKNFSK